MPDLTGRGDVAALGRVDRVEMADPFAVLGILSVRDVDGVLVDDRRADHLVARLRPDRVLRVEVELPQLLARLRLVAAHPAVTLADHDLHGIADPADGRRRPLPVENLLADG